nr:MAG TPA: hypothetical protein [Inoviridae sp.]
MFKFFYICRSGGVFQFSVVQKNLKIYFKKTSFMVYSKNRI